MTGGARTRGYPLRNRKKKKCKQDGTSYTSDADVQNEKITKFNVNAIDDSSRVTSHALKQQVIKAALFGTCILSGIGLFQSIKTQFGYFTTSKLQIHDHRRYNEDDVLEEPPQWDTHDPLLNNTFVFLSKYVCEDKIGYQKEARTTGFCHHRLRPAPERRTHYIARTQSNARLQKGETILVLPRHFLIWDLDAMRDRFIRKELFSARHKGTGNALDSGAFLAAYLIRRKHVGESIWEEHKSKGNEYNIYTDENTERLLEFLSMLPTYENLKETHPTLWSEEMLMSYFGKSTPSYDLIHGYQTMIISEYSAFCQASISFQKNVKEREYTMMRLNVMSRSFGPGPPQKEEQLKDGSNNDMTLDDELSHYEKEVGVDLTKGCRAMSPILDMWDHHARPNVEWRYQRRKRSFEIKVAEGGITSGNDVMVSYGKYTDTHLFAKFGFVNGDGSGYTEASVAVAHQILDIDMGQQFSLLKAQKISGVHKMIPLPKDGAVQKQSLLQYLIFDDGYNDCIERDHNSDAYNLKLLKFQHLQHIANIRDRWIIKMPPRDLASKPAINSSIPVTKTPPRFDSKGLSFDGSKVISTCRLLTLNNDDFNGRASEVLSSILRNDTADTFFVPKQTDQLEFRALSCLARLTTVALKRYNTNVPRDMRSLSAPPTDDIFFGSKGWNALHVRLGEMQTLEVLRSIATSGARQMQQQVKSLHLANLDLMPAMSIRQRPCPFKMTHRILDDQ